MFFVQNIIKCTDWCNAQFFIKLISQIFMDLKPALSIQILFKKPLCISAQIFHQTKDNVCIACAVVQQKLTTPGLFLLAVAVACKNFFSKLSFFPFFLPSVLGRSWQGGGRAGWAEQWECGAGIVGENLGWSHSVWSAPPLPSSSFCSAAKAISTSYWHQQ